MTNKEDRDIEVAASNVLWIRRLRNYVASLRMTMP